MCVCVCRQEDANSLFHAASLGFWGVHDRTSLLREAVRHTLNDPKAQFLIYERWSAAVAADTPSGSRPVSIECLNKAPPSYIIDYYYYRVL